MIRWSGELPYTQTYTCCSRPVYTLSPELKNRSHAQAAAVIWPWTCLYSFFFLFLRVIWICLCIFHVWPMITYIYVFRPSSFVYNLQTGSRIYTLSFSERIYTFCGLRNVNVFCRTENVYIRWSIKACLLLIVPIKLHLLSSQPMEMQHYILNWFVLKK